MGVYVKDPEEELIETLPLVDVAAYRKAVPVGNPGRRHRACHGPSGKYWVHLP